MERQQRAYLYALATILFWSTSASAFKVSLRFLTGEELLFYASFVSLLVLFGLVAGGGRLHELRSWAARDYRRSAVLGLLNPFLYYLVLFRAYALLPAQEAQPINFVWPIVLVGFSIVILGQPFRTRTLLAMLTSFLGVVVISTRGDLFGLHFSSVAGVAYALASSVIWGLNWVYGVEDRRDPGLRLAVSFLFGFVYLTLYLLLFTELRVPPVQGLLGAAYVGVFEMGVTFVLWLKALRLSRTTAQISNLIYVTPFLALVVTHYVVGETIRGSTLAGLGLIVLGIAAQHLGAGGERPRAARI